MGVGGDGEAAANGAQAAPRLAPLTSPPPHPTPPPTHTPADLPKPDSSRTMPKLPKALVPYALTMPKLR